MSLKDIFQVSYILTTVVMSYAGKNCEKDQILDTTLESVQEYNGMKMQNVVLLASSSYFIRNEDYLRELWGLRDHEQLL